GATGFSHVNDSGFWMISRYMGMTEKQTLKTWTLISTAISFVSFAIILLLGLFIK
ncbi:MAG: gluconate transporter, partial [Verrucomicrobiaceae bacterium]|nr:gluconate transporter [Verrucomicrobiaceae bacterium]